MLLKTHFAISVFFILLLISHVEHKISFVFLALIATYLPDIDNSFSVVGRRFRFLKLFVKHRGLFHSFIFLFAIIFVLVLFFPVLALGFFLGYSLHLFADSFTLEGIKPFYPLKKNSSWKIKKGGRKETFLFILILISDVVLLIVKVFNFS